MSRIHGKPIDSEEIERIVSREFTPQGFASLCNSIAWASAGRRCSSLPSFTERVNAKDGGVDAEWESEFPDDGNYTSPLLGPGWNVFQYKQRDIFAQGREKTFSSLIAGLKGALKDLYDKTKKRPDRYVLFTNLDLMHGQKGELKARILSDYDQADRVHVEIVGAAELTAYLNNLPHLRSTFFIPEEYSTWQLAWLVHSRQKLFGANVELIGRERELANLRSMVDNPEIRVIVLSGPHNIGKTRLALQATDHRPVETVVALDPRSMSVSGLLALETPNTETIILIEDPEPDQAEKFVNQVLSHTGLKLLITLPTAENAPAPSFGRDERVQSIQLGPLSDTDAQELLKAAGAKFDYSLAMWIVEQAGGNPGVLLVAASLGAELRRTAASFADDVARAFEKEIRRKLGDNAIRVLQLLSLLTHIGIRRKAFNEIETICALFGDSLHPNAVLNSIPQLEKAGIVRVGGSYAEVIPPLLANRLAASALRGRLAELYALFVALDQVGRFRLVRRLRTLKGDEVALFWDELFSVTGLLRDLPSVLANSQLLRLVAGTVPEKAANLIEKGLKQAKLAERLTITGNTRRGLMGALEELLFRRRTSAVAMRCLALLAEAETENFANNATGVFRECFHPRHPQFPLPLHERLNLLREILSSENSIEMRLLGIKAIQSGLNRMGVMVSLRHSNGPEPFDAPPPMTYGDIQDYGASLVDFLMMLAQSEEPRLAESAIAALPRVIADSVFQTRPEIAIARFQTVVDWVLTRKLPIAVSDLTEALRLVRSWFSDYLHKDKVGDEKEAAKIQEYLGQIEGLLNALNRGDFPTRLKRWTGNWTQDEHEYETEEEKKKHISRAEKERWGLAQEVVQNPDVLTDDLLEWLCSEEAKQSYKFFWSLGKADLKTVLLPKVEHLGADKAGVNAFSAYFGGLSQIDRLFVSQRLDELTKACQVMAEAIVGATGHLAGDIAGVQRMEKLILEKRVDPVFVQRVLMGRGWIDTLSPDEYLRLLKAIAGSKLENAAAAIDFLGVWMHDDRPIEGQLAEFAWQCLEAAPPVTVNEAFDCDQLAAKLARSDAGRGFKLLEKLLTQPYDRGSWNPLDNYGQNNFWNALHETDAERSLQVVLSLVLSDISQYFTWDLREVIDPQMDSETLIQFAFESERHAEVVCGSIAAGRPGFWHIAFRIAEKYPSSSKIKGALADGVIHTERSSWGAWSTHLGNGLKEVERVLSDDTTPPIARTWLEQLASSLRTQIDQESLSEADREVDYLMPFVENTASPERLWAIKKLLQLGKTDDLRRLLSQDEILDVVLELDLSPKELRDAVSELGIRDYARHRISELEASIRRYEEKYKMPFEAYRRLWESEDHEANYSQAQSDYLNWGALVIRHRRLMENFAWLL